MSWNIAIHFLVKTEISVFIDSSLVGWWSAQIWSIASTLIIRFHGTLVNRLVFGWQPVRI
jgi:hypothetical protein